MSDMAPEDDFVRITLRIPARLHQQLTEAAAKKRSMNAEIITRLETTFEGDVAKHFSDVSKIEDYFQAYVARMLDEQVRIACNSAARDVITVFREARAAGDTIDEMTLDFFDRKLAEERERLEAEKNSSSVSRRKTDPTTPSSPTPKRPSRAR